MRNIDRRICTGALAALAAALLAAGTAQAHDGGHARREVHAQRHEAYRGAREFRFEGHDDRRWHDRHAFRPEGWRGPGWAQPAYWRTGRWDQRCREGRCGWWWWAGGRWFYYERPVYPCPPWSPAIGAYAPLPGYAVPGY